MEALRVQSRTEQGRRELLSNSEEFLSTLARDPENSDAIAVLANLFSCDGENAPLLGLLQTKHSEILPRLIELLSQCHANNPMLFLSLSVAVGNCWAQSKLHRTELRKLGAPSVMLQHVGNEKSRGLMLRGMIKMMSLEQVGDLTKFSPQDVELVVSLAEQGDTLATELLFCSITFVSCSDAAELQERIAVLLAREEDDSMVVEFALEVCKSLPEVGLFEHKVLLGRLEQCFDSKIAAAQACEVFAHLLSLAQPNSLLYERLCGNALARWGEIVSETSARIPHKPSERVLDQQTVLPFATLRLQALTCMSLLVAKGGERSAKQCLPHSPLLAEMCLQYYEYDYEATRAAALVLKHTSLCDAREFLRLVPTLPHMVSKVIRSQDHHTSFILCGIFRTVCQRAGSLHADSFQALTLDKQALLAILSVDLTKLHPHARVELCRAFAYLMQSEFTSDGGGGLLETVQVVKFVSFLLASNTPELQLEALNAIKNLSAAILKALPQFDIEVLPGTLLIDRIKEIHLASKDCVDSLAVVQVSQACERILAVIE